MGGIRSIFGLLTGFFKIVFITIFIVGVIGVAVFGLGTIADTDSVDQTGNSDPETAADAPHDDVPEYPPRIEESWDRELLPHANDPGHTNITTSEGRTIHSEHVEQYIIHYVNEYRNQRGLQTWDYSLYLASTSRAHSWDMHHRNFFSHENPDGQRSWDRFESDEYCHTEYGENLLKTFVDVPTDGPNGDVTTYATEREVGQAVVKYWQESPSHNELLLDTKYDNAGVGVYITKASDGRGFVVLTTLNVCT